MTHYISGKKTTLCLVPDYSEKLSITSGSTLTENVYVVWHYMSLNGGVGHFYINDIAVDVVESSSHGTTNGKFSMFFGFIAKGSKVSWTGTSVAFYKVE